MVWNYKTQIVILYQMGGPHTHKTSPVILQKGMFVYKGCKTRKSLYHVWSIEMWVYLTLDVNVINTTVGYETRY